MTTAVGPVVIGSSSRGDTKPFFHSQTELSFKSEQGSDAIWVLKIAATHPEPFRARAGNIVFKAARTERPHSPAQLVVMWDKTDGVGVTKVQNLKSCRYDFCSDPFNTTTSHITISVLLWISKEHFTGCTFIHIEHVVFDVMIPSSYCYSIVMTF